MPKVTGPLFGTTAHGKMPGIGSFRRSRNGVIFQKESPPAPPPTARQLVMRNCLTEARRAWAASPTKWISGGGVSVKVYVTPWSVWWPAWQASHPECSA